ncbi:Lin1244/Lin1753 domain-containing protein [Enterococcus nangangensis]|uniref:Lin1244/Lin1753 domain-containing protein n=1 Tax=Enterococcus nangangensis TaxID=2559926 RepID=UPI001485198F|nr:Lin1244/Lin1753 domain-containing protein [Enterococcus nangangensis]
MNNYFPHDSNSRNSDKLLPVRMKFGAEGYGIYFMILERLREEKTYTSVKDYNMIAFDLRVDAQKVKSIVEDFGLFAFTDDGECFYSEGFLKRMEIKDEKSKKRSDAGKKGAAKRWQTDSNAIAMPITNDSKESKEKETKEKETKEKDSRAEEKQKEEAAPANSENMFQAYQHFFGHGFSPVQAEDMHKWAEDISEPLVIEAMKRAAIGMKSYGYSTGIMKKWADKGIKTIQGVTEDDKRFNSSQGARNDRKTANQLEMERREAEIERDYGTLPF